MSGTDSGLPELEEPCDACNGTGDAPPATPYEPRASLNCPKCKGHKLAPTEAGQKLIEFIKRRFNLPEREAHRSLFG
ncbi:hypothetical protein Sj15T_24380 [Sphingobium sp. TA15]|uniref:Uncharacterized protein n=1 Tax=Sphingobium indicum (strain DSM 16413 / CCM 7287 / MTCC 6362 / UT26 / NBRC 101211 / UT26S) TaxID=452662 RepID=D4Z607_SPHIU|nr:hypothetical protein [Sphingobium indicum]BAI98039.1 hypothetical protein SJA_C1-32050 [Sphingobium indicum UT26S]BDD67417.1 hypothetical protein Sj15T_24380 [Sphingobium sp. TA15]